jgi:hypothetical protein
MTTKKTATEDTTPVTLDPLLKQKIEFVMFVLDRRLWKGDEFFNAEQATDQALKAWNKLIK